MKLASEPIGLVRAAQTILARVEMKYGSDVFERGEWWWELDERAKPEYEWARAAIFKAAHGTEYPAGSSYASLCGIKVKYVDAKEPGDVGRLCLHTDRKLPGDRALLR